MTDDQENSFKRDVIERLNKAKDCLQQSGPEMRKLISASGVFETAKKIIHSKNIERISDGLKKLADVNFHARIKQGVVELKPKHLFAKAGGCKV